MPQNHKLLHELKAICKDNGINQGKAVLTYELYMELCEVHKLWNVEYHFHQKLNMFYVTGKHKKNDDICDVYVPFQTNELLSIKHVEKLQEILSPVNKSLILAFRDEDSSSTHYRVRQGLTRPDSPTTAQAKKIEEKKNIQFKKYVTKWRKKLYTRALKDKNKHSLF